ncbi:uncharacterized protein B0P05DRAFT_592386 [Gilbertella persicaria]|uniref:uncharacterized protein n=1 Tax=Gilbertella persicaria TaxID=101096 RepID=UPI00221E9C8C|nr:uncharacterized protein B0P05DRAFT_592386 [Gilbertella persicaria]KAI8048037.1 hypothetical protein B0P05DRAFT_592386 [Gilbertella persicaria]
MKIKKTSSKNLLLCELIKRLETDGEDHIPTLVQKLIRWPYPRGDLFYWVAVLDRFDIILNRICTDYNLKEIQTKSFYEQDKQLLLSIIELSRTLFENCTNRNIYNSYEASKDEQKKTILPSLIAYVYVIEYI